MHSQAKGYAEVVSAYAGDAIAVQERPPIDAALRGVEDAMESACNDFLMLQSRLEAALGPRADQPEKVAQDCCAAQSDLTTRLWAVHDRIRRLQRWMGETSDRCELPFVEPKPCPPGVTRAR